jgi:squalene-associated FAD-dependent desaturase
MGRRARHAGGASVSAGAPQRPRVLVVGGGLAGIAAALDCAAAGASVTLVEVRRRLGGAAYSFERDGLVLDNGQHVFLRCCHAYRGLLERLGSAQFTFVQPRLEIPVLSPGHAPVLLRRGSLPAPAHLAFALARYPHLTPAERLGAARAALALMRLDPSDPALEVETFGAWLARHGQGERAVSALWDLVALPTLNLPAAQASLALAAFVFRTGLLSGADAGDIGFHRGALAETIGAPAERALREAGVEVRLGWRAERIERSGDVVAVHGRGARGEGAGSDEGAAPDDGAAGEEAPAAGEERAGAGALQPVRADATILAVPHMRASRLLEPLLGARAAAWRGLGSSPIINLHVVYDRVVSDMPFAAGVRTPVQYVFDRSDAAGVPAGHQCLAVSLSGAEREMEISSGELRERYLPALGELFPRARDAKVEFFLATREHAATFRAAPGVGALRPHAQTALPGLVLAGAWTATGWPATLEGAVLSGHAAAAATLRRLGLDPESSARAHVAADTASAASGEAVEPPAATAQRELAR